MPLSFNFGSILSLLSSTPSLLVATKCILSLLICQASSNFVEEYPQLCETSLDSSKVVRLLSDGDECTELQTKYGLDVEYSESYSFKKS